MDEGGFDWVGGAVDGCVCGWRRGFRSVHMAVGTAIGDVTVLFEELLCHRACFYFIAVFRCSCYAILFWRQWRSLLPIE